MSGPEPRHLAASLLASALLSIAALLAPITAHADERDMERAREHFERGVALYEEGGFDAALVEFLQAYELAPNYRILYNIGQIHFQLNDYAEALRTFEQYLDEGGDEIPEARRRLVERDVATLRERVGTLELEVNVDGATVLLDDVAIGTTPLEPVTINIGRHVLRVDAPGYRSETQRITIASRARLALEIELVAGSGVSPLAAEAGARSSAGRSAALWTLGATAVLSGIGAGIAFGFAVDANSTIDGQLAQFPAGIAAIESSRDQLRASALAADVLVAVALASATAFVVVLVATDGGGPAPASEPGEDAAAQAARPEARIELGPGRLAVSGTF